MEKAKAQQEVEKDLEVVANGGSQNIADLYNKGSSTTEGLANVEKLKG